MLKVDVKKGEPIDRALKRLKSKIDLDGMLEDVKRLRSFETPQQKRKRKTKLNHKKQKTFKNRFNDFQI